MQRASSEARFALEKHRTYGTGPIYRKTGGRVVYRREHLRALAQRVEVADHEVRIMGSKGDLLRTLVTASGGKSAGIGVPAFVPKLRSGRD